MTLAVTGLFGRTTAPWRVLTMSERSGGRAPPLDARAASSSGRWDISPWSFGPSSYSTSYACLVDGVRNTDKVTPSDTVERMACRAHFEVNGVTATNAKSYWIDTRIGNERVQVISYLAWSNDCIQPLSLQGYAGGCRPASPAELACTSPTNGNEPKTWVYQATEPRVARVAPASAVRDVNAS